MGAAVTFAPFLGAPASSGRFSVLCSAWPQIAIIAPADGAGDARSSASAWRSASSWRARHSGHDGIHRIPRADLSSPACSRSWLGLAIVNAHNLWMRDWRVIVTILGWLFVLARHHAAAVPRIGADARRQDRRGSSGDHSGAAITFVSARSSASWATRICGARRSPGGERTRPSPTKRPRRKAARRLLSI